MLFLKPAVVKQKNAVFYLLLAIEAVRKPYEAILEFNFANENSEFGSQLQAKIGFHNRRPHLVYICIPFVYAKIWSPKFPLGCVVLGKSFVGNFELHILAQHFLTASIVRHKGALKVLFIVGLSGSDITNSLSLNSERFLFFLSSFPILSQ